jgi:hypothetical protein
MKDCESLRILISERLDGRLDQVEEARVESHIQSCSACAEWEADLRAAESAARDLPPLSLPAGLAERIRQSAARPRQGPRILRFLLAAAAAALVLGLGLGYFLTRPVEPDPAVLQTRIGEHLQACGLFFDHAEKLRSIPSASEASLISAELEGTKLRERTRELLRLGTDPEVERYLRLVDRALQSASDLQALRVQASGVLAEISRVQERTGHRPRPIVISIRPASSDPDVESYLKARTSLYRGDERAAAEIFKSLESGGMRDFAIHGRARLLTRQGHNAEALEALLGLSRAWKSDPRTIEIIKDLSAKEGVQWTDQGTMVIDIEKLLSESGLGECLVVKSSTMRRLAIPGRVSQFLKRVGIATDGSECAVKKQMGITYFVVDLDALPEEKRQSLTRELRKFVPGLPEK